MPNENHTLGSQVNLGPSVLISEAISNSQGSDNQVDESHVRLGMRRKPAEAEAFPRRRI